MRTDSKIRTAMTVAAMAAGILIPSTAQANGLLLYELSPSGVAQGGAMVADGSEPSAVAFNSAAMANLPGLQLQASVYTYISSNHAEDLRTGQGTDAERGVFPIPSIFVTYKPLDWMSVGLASYSMYGLALTWPDAWPGRAAVEKASLRSYQVQPSIAFGPFAGVSIGGGVDVIYGSVDLRQGLPLGDDTWGSSKIVGQTVGVGFNAGVFYQAAEWMTLGAHFRSPVKMKLDPGDVDFEAPAAFDDQLRDQKVRTSINLPPMLTIGARMNPSERFSFEADLNYVWWSVYDKLEFDFDDPHLHQVQKKDWHDAIEARIGGQFSAGQWRVRGGFILDESPVPDETLGPDLPDNWRLIPSVGGGYVVSENFEVDAAYHFVYILPRDADNPEVPYKAHYTGHVHTVSVGATARF